MCLCLSIIFLTGVSHLTLWNQSDSAELVLLFLLTKVCLSIILPQAGLTKPLTCQGVRLEFQREVKVH